MSETEAPSGPKYPQITVQLTGQDGNAMSIIGRVSRAMRAKKVPQEEVEMFVKEAVRSTDYPGLIAVIEKWVDVW